MTAVVGILNKDAIAIAADSAVTISGSNGTKILNGANKLFRLSKYQPVGIMLYNSASFMGTPWETIIKLYRRTLGDRSFPELGDYVNDFIAYLKVQNFFSNDATIKSYLAEQFQSALFEIIPKDFRADFMNSQIADADKGDVIVKIQESASLRQVFWSKSKKTLDFETFARAEYDKEMKVMVEELIKSWFVDDGYTVTEDFKEQIHNAIHLYICCEQADSCYTGVIFSGFGDLDLYPLLIPVNISFAYNTRLHYFVDIKRKAAISYTNQGVISPFAQQDVMNTILTGVDPNLERIFISNLWRSFEKFKTEVLNALGDNNQDVKDAILGIETKSVVDEMMKSNFEVKRKKYIEPLVSAVASLSKQDLAEMAESLIYLTYLKRRITFAEESVGGPVDVAIISKGDGFIWIKRKHYFDAKLNQHFFDNYYNL